MVKMVLRTFSTSCSRYAPSQWAVSRSASETSRHPYCLVFASTTREGESQDPKKKGRGGTVSLTPEELARTISQEPHPLVQPPELPFLLFSVVAQDLGVVLDHAAERLGYPGRLQAPRPQPIHDRLLVPDDAVAVAVVFVERLVAVADVHQRRPPRPCAGRPRRAAAAAAQLLGRGWDAGLGELQEFVVLGWREHIVQHDGVAAAVVRQRRRLPVDRRDGHWFGVGRLRGEEVGGDGHGVGLVAGQDALALGYRVVV